jgi:hypothetical protein
MNHTIKFDNPDHMVLWLLDNNLDDTPISLTIHLEDHCVSLLTNTITTSTQKGITP